MTSFEHKLIGLLHRVMAEGQEVEVGEWQSQNVRDNPDMISRELMHQTFRMSIPPTRQELDVHMGPTLSRPWAEDHFAERVSGYPLNPPPSESYWPYAQQGNAAHKEGEIFHHTYPERMWPKHAGLVEEYEHETHVGIHYKYGDLMDVVKQLKKNPLTRQAYLPIWFPEDTGACGTENQRVPCTLGYHFLIRPNEADIVYYIRSCDLLRHFTDDVYMAARLLQWVMDAMPDLRMPMKLVMHISSLHIFKGDYPIVEHRLNQYINREDEEPQYGAAV